MSLYKFLKDKGKKLMDERDAVATKAITKEVKDLGFWEKLGKDFKVRVEGEKVKLEGEVPDQETREKLILAAGNVDGISEVEDSMSAKAGGDAAVFHEVKKGDTLSKIAQTYLGKASRYPEIFEANKPMLDHPDKIYPGQVLRIPGGKA